LVILSTLYDVYSRLAQNQNGETMESRTVSETRISTSEKGVKQRLLSSFSVYSNGKQILTTKAPSDSLTALHGLRFFSMTWVIFGHTYAGAIERNIDNVVEFLDDIKNRFADLFINSTFCVDTFLFTSGLLVSFNFYKAMQKTNGTFNLAQHYLHRYLRITPAYAMVLAYVTSFYPVIGRGPLSSTFNQEPKNCKQNWWTNLLYINNFVGTGKMCMGHTWYLACDMQLFVLAPVILYPLCRWPRAGYVLLTMALVSSVLTPMVLTAVYDLIVTFIPTYRQRFGSNEYLDYMSVYYTKPFSRSGPYVVGMILGYLLAKHGTNLRLNKKTQVVGWFLSTTTCIALIFGIHDVILGKHQLPLVYRILYNGLSRTAWGIALSWITLACVTGYGGFVNTILSSKFLLPLSRLTYCGYLIHVYVLKTYVKNLNAVAHFSHFSQVMLFLGALLLTFLISFLISVMFELPFLTLDKTLLGTNKKKNKNKGKSLRMA